MTYSTPPSKAVLAAIKATPSRIYIQDWDSKDTVDTRVSRLYWARSNSKAAEELERDKTICNWPNGRDIYPYGKGLSMQKTESKDESLCTSILPYIKSNQKEDLVEAVCRDIDAYSVVFKGVNFI